MIRFVRILRLLRTLARAATTLGFISLCYSYEFDILHTPWRPSWKTIEMIWGLRLAVPIAQGLNPVIKTRLQVGESIDPCVAVKVSLQTKLPKRCPQKYKKAFRLHFPHDPNALHSLANVLASQVQRQALRNKRNFNHSILQGI
jgi:hypothetical protein